MLTLAKHPTMTAPKKNNSHSLKQTQNTFMCLASLVQCMYFRRFTKSQSHLQQIPPISFILPQLCAHGAFKIIKQLVTELFFHSLCIRSSLHSIPCRPHQPFPGPLACVAHSIHGGARCEELLHDGGLAVESRVVQRCPTSGAEGLGDVNGAPPRGSPLPTPTLEWKRPEVCEFHLYQNCIASWLNGSH